MRNYTATVKAVPQRDKSGNERRSARRGSGAVGNIPACKNVRRGESQLTGTCVKHRNFQINALRNEREADWKRNNGNTLFGNAYG